MGRGSTQLPAFGVSWRAEAGTGSPVLGCVCVCVCHSRGSSPAHQGQARHPQQADLHPSEAPTGGLGTRQLPWTCSLSLLPRPPPHPKQQQSQSLWGTPVLWQPPKLGEATGQVLGLCQHSLHRGLAWGSPRDPHSLHGAGGAAVTKATRGDPKPPPSRPRDVTPPKLGGGRTLGWRRGAGALKIRLQPQPGGSAGPGGEGTSSPL